MKGYKWGYSVPVQLTEDIWINLFVSSSTDSRVLHERMVRAIKKEFASERYVEGTKDND